MGEEKVLDGLLTYLALLCRGLWFFFFPQKRLGRGKGGEGVVECQFTALFELLHKISPVVI